jgi:cell division protein FtsN
MLALMKGAQRCRPEWSRIAPSNAQAALYVEEQTMSENQTSLQQTHSSGGGSDQPDPPREPKPPTTEDLPDLPAPEEVGEDG